MNSVVSLACVTGSTLGLLLAMTLLWRRDQSCGNIVLATLVFLAAVDVFLAFVKCALLDDVASVVDVPIYISLLFAPLLLQFLTTPTEEIPFAYRWRLHFGLFAAVQCMMVLEIWTRATFPWLTIHKIVGFSVALVLVLYITRCMQKVLTPRMPGTDWPEFHNHNVARISVISMALCQLLISVVPVLFDGLIANMIINILYCTMACFLIILTYSFLHKAVSYEQPADIPDISKEKYGNNRLPEFVRELIINNLVKHMHSEKPWLKIDLTLGQLADGINVNPHHLSQIINSHFRKSFACFINEYRVKAACQLLTVSNDKTVLEIALESGFSSKSSFNTLFKRQTGLTPSEYRKKFQKANCVAA